MVKLLRIALSALVLSALTVGSAVVLPDVAIAKTKKKATKKSTKSKKGGKSSKGKKGRKAAPAKPVNWAERLGTTVEGGIRIGNPDADVKLVEFGSLSCSHCKDFHAAALPVLKSKYLRAGKLSYEFRSFVRNGADYATSLLLQCVDARPGLDLVNTFFTQQDRWTQNYATLTADDMAQVNAVPEADRPAKMAELAKLPGFVAPRGFPRSRYDACLASKPAQDRLMAIRAEAINVYKLEGTPTFVLNGRTVTGVYDWSSLEPRIVAALADN